jgi:thiol-disulfide isomerase/thioredoxin
LLPQNEIQADVSKLDANQKKHYDLVLAKIPREDLYKNPITFNQKKIVIINFWATWCTPCLEELPSLNKLAKDFQEDIVVIGINSDYEESEIKIKKFLAQRGIAFPNFHDKDNKIADDFLIKSLPVTLIYVNGSIKELIKGTKDFQSQEFISQINDWLKLN